MTTEQMIWAILIAFAIGGAFLYFQLKLRKDLKQEHLDQLNAQNPPKEKASSSLQLQAYERLILLIDRISLPNLITRVNQPGLSLKEMQLLLTQTIRQEFDYNITQQIYVSQEAWDAVKNMKDQNILIINQVAGFMPAEASGTDLAKAILEMVMNNPKVSLQEVVSEALTFEAKKLLK